MFSKFEMQKPNMGDTRNNYTENAILIWTDRKRLCNKQLCLFLFLTDMQLPGLFLLRIVQPIYKSVSDSKFTCAKK